MGWGRGGGGGVDEMVGRGRGQEMGGMRREGREAGGKEGKGEEGPGRREDRRDGRVEERQASG